MAPTIPRKKYGEAFERSFASAKPAIVETRRIIEIDPAHTRVEFKSCLPTGSALNKLCQDDSECPGAPKYCSLDLNEVPIIKMNG